MLQEVIDLQSKAVENLIYQSSIKDEITFKSPTGSGKTYMMADFMDRMLEKNEDIIFIVSSLSKGDIAKQNHEKFIEYTEKGFFKNLDSYLITSENSGENALDIPITNNVYVLPRDLYKDKSKLKQGALLNFLYAQTDRIPFGNGKIIYLIKDECHIATTNLDSLRENFFTKVFNFSATPKLSRGQTPDVEITELDSINTHLIKCVEYQDESESLNQALTKFEIIKSKYNEQLGINPCIIIQISNKDKAEEEWQEIKKCLGNHKDLKWMSIVEDAKKCDTNDIFKEKKLPIKKWKEYAKPNSSTIDVIIFKMVITEGWDIPRACMLYQIRDSKSKQLDEQVVGRIRRNPCLLDYEELSNESKELISKAYVWGLKPKESEELRQVNLVGNKKQNEVQEELKLKITRIKRPLENTTFNVKDFLKKQKAKIVSTSIFDLYKKYVKCTPEVKEMYNYYIDSEAKWFEFMENFEKITEETKNIACDYDKNMELVKDENGNNVEVTFPLISYYTENEKVLNIQKWVWKRTDGNTYFSFDSEAEKEWVEILVSLINEDNCHNTGRLVKDIEIQEVIDNEQNIVKKYILGKNYLANSEIKYEYYLNGIRSSYPDFIMKDFLNRIHIFESKSLNQSHDSSIDKEQYEEKIRALKECYKYASKLTGYYFYIPIKQDNNWNIYQYYNGYENLLSKEKFIKFINTPNEDDENINNDLKVAENDEDYTLFKY